MKYPKRHNHARVCFYDSGRRPQKRELVVNGHFCNVLLQSRESPFLFCVFFHIAHYNAISTVSAWFVFFLLGRSFLLCEKVKCCYIKLPINFTATGNHECSIIFLHQIIERILSNTCIQNSFPIFLLIIRLLGPHMM